MGGINIINMITYEDALEEINSVTIQNLSLDTIELIKEALKSKIATKPKIIDKGWGEIRLVETCPNCGAWMPDEYCNICGQHIDWSDYK